MIKFSKEFWVGCLVLLVVALMLVFGSLMGVLTPFSREAKFAVLYDFAGGVEAGSAVRVAGVKVGKVESIEFLMPGAQPTQEGEKKEPSLRVTVSVAKRALPAVRQDSRFYVNMAGIIGERYIEISPGRGPALEPGAVVRGIDPPRIDQLLSQGYSVFGRIQEFMDDKQETISDFLDQLSLLMTDTNKFLKGKENRQAFFSLINNLNAVSAQLKEGLKDEESKKFFKTLAELVKRAEQVDRATLKKFLQEEGIRAHIF